MSEPFAIEPRPEPPELWGKPVVTITLDEAIGAVAADLFQQARACVSQFGDFHLALSGDAMLEPVYRRLMYDPPLRNFPWAKTHLWMIEEAKPDGEIEGVGSKSAMIHDLFAFHSGIPNKQIHEISLEGEDPAEEYQSELREVLEWREKGHDRLDVALLCLNDDDPALSMTRTRVDAQPLIAADAGRIAMTPRLINASRLIGVFAAGAECRDRLGRISNDQSCSWRSIEPVGGVLHWYLDRAACPDRADV